MTKYNNIKTQTFFRYQKSNIIHNRDSQPFFVATRILSENRQKNFGPNLFYRLYFKHKNLYFCPKNVVISKKEKVFTLNLSRISRFSTQKQ